MATLQSITIDFIGKHINLYKRHLRYWPNLQSLVYKRLGYNIINESQIEETLMPYTVLSNKLNQLTNLVIDFIKETKKINTAKRVELTFSPSILQLILKCTFASKGLAVDLCGRIRDEKVKASESPDIVNRLRQPRNIDLVLNVINDYEDIKHTMFTRTIKYAPVLKKSLGKRLKEIITREDDIATRFGVDNWISIREEPNKIGPEIFARHENGVKKGKTDQFCMVGWEEAAVIIVKVSPIGNCKYVSGIEFYGNRRICTPMKIIGPWACLCDDMCIKDVVVEGEYDFICRLGTSDDRQLVSQICYIPEGTGIRNISYKRDNLGFLDIKFHTEETNLKEGNFLLTEARYNLLQDQVLNPLYLFGISTFTCEYKKHKIIRDFGGRFYSNRLKLECEQLRKIVDDLKKVGREE